MKKKILNLLVSLPFKIIAGLFLLYLLFGYFAINPLAQRILPWVAENKLASKASVDKVSFDPFGLSFTLDNFRLTQTSGEELAGFDRLYINLETSGIFRFAIRLQDIQLTGPKALVEVKKDGSLNWSQLIAKLNENKQEDEDKGMPRLLIDHILIEHGDVRYIDHRREEPLRVVLQPLGLELDALSTLPEDRGDYSIVANLPEQGGTLKWKGTMGLNPIVSNGSVQLEGFKLVKLLQFAQQPMPVELTQGKLQASFSYDFSMVQDQPKATLRDLNVGLAKLAGTVPVSPATFSLNSLEIKVPHVDFAMQPSPQVRFEGMNVKFKEAGLKYGKGELLRLPLLNISDIALDLATRKVSVAQLSIHDANLQAVRDKSGMTDWQRIASSFASIPAAPSAEMIANSPDSQVVETTVHGDDQAPWDVHIDSFALKALGIHIEDQVAVTPVVLDVQDTQAEVRNISLDMTKALPIQLALNIKQGGRLEVQGNVQPSPLSGDMDIKLAGLSLKPFGPYVNQVAMLRLNDGDVNVTGKLKRTSGKTLSTNFKGGFKVDQLAITEEHGGAPFLGWKRLASDQLELSLAPNRLHLGELRLIQPFGKFIIYEDKSLNITHVLKKQEPSAAPPVMTEKEASSEEFPVQIDRVRISNASMDFADLSLLPQFGTHVHTLSGVINGLSTNPKTTAQVELDGMVDEFGSARVRGSVQPFKATDFTDLKVVFRNLDMNRLTPYSGKFAGRRIDSGKLSVDLEYKIKNRQLAGENQVVINKLRLGERVDSPDAMSLPLDLAIALLEDSSGVIDLNLPVSGNLDDPQFSYGKIVWKAFVNILTKVVTSPFRALGNLLGIESDKLEAVVFDAGKSHLLPPEQEKLKTLAEALAKRPALTVSLEPSYDSVADVKELQELAIRFDVAKKMGLKVRNGEQAGPLDLSNTKTQDAIESLYADRIKGASSKKLMEKLTDVFTKPKQPEPTFEEQVKQLQENVQVSETELVALAQARSAEITQYLKMVSGLPEDKMTVLSVSKHADGKDTVNVKLSLGAKVATN